MRLVVLLTKSDVLILYNEICQHFKDLHNSNDQCMMLQNLEWLRDPFKVSDKQKV